METKEKPKDPNDPREYQAIPHAIQGIAIVAVVAAVLGAINVGIWSAGRNVPRAEGHWILFAFSLLGMAAVSMLALWGIARTAFDIQSGQGVRAWLKAYWLRNVLGYRLACFFGHPLAGKPLLHSIIAPGAPVVYVEQPALLIPLGGWFRRPTIVMPKDLQFPLPYVGPGQIEIERLDLLHQNGTERAIAGSVLRLADRQGNRMTLTVWQALEIIERHGIGVLTGLSQSLMNVLGDLSRRAESLTNDAQRITAERDEAKRLADESAKQLEGAGFQVIAFLQKTIKAIEESSRLKDGLEGLLLLRRLHSETIKRCEAASLARVTDLHRAQLAVVDAQIVEKQKRDRRRHGKPATTSAP